MLSEIELRGHCGQGWREIDPAGIPPKIYQLILENRRRALAEIEKRSLAGTTVRAGAGTVYAQVSSFRGACMFPGCSADTGIGFWTCPDHRDFEDQFDPDTGMPIDGADFTDEDSRRAAQVRRQLFLRRIS